MISNQYSTGSGFPQDVLFDQERAKRLFEKKWFFAGMRADVPRARDFLKFSLFDEEYFLLHSPDRQIRCMVNRCSHQSARLIRSTTGKCSASLICPNHQWAYDLNGGSLRNAPGFAKDYPQTQDGKSRGLSSIPLVEVGGLLFGCLGENPDQTDLEEIRSIISPYCDSFALADGGYKLAHHHSEIVNSSWLSVMINNRECCHCKMNHKGLTNLFDPSSFNGAATPAYEGLLQRAIERWNSLGLKWEEQAFKPNDCLRVARYPMQERYKSITFDGEPASKKLIGPFTCHDSSTLSIWLNPNAWIHYTSDHIATNWVLPLTADTCVMHSSWIVHEDAVEGDDYSIEHLTDVWKVTNAEDVTLCNSMTSGAKSRHYRAGPFAEDERFCTQFCDWYMTHSA